MSNEYFQPGSVPAPNSPGASAVIRNEFSSIATAFDKLPTLADNAGFLIAVDPTGTRLISAGFNVNEIVTLDGIQTLTNKTIAWADNTFPGFGTAATKNASTVPGTGEVPVMVGPNLFGAIDGSNLINLNTDNFGDVVPVSKGGTGASDVSGAQANLGIDLKADSFNAVFTGAPVAPTPSIGDNSPRIATTQFVQESLVVVGGFGPSNEIPLMDGVASSGSGALGSREDHTHPSDTTRAPSSAATAIGTSFSPAGGVSATNVQAAIAELDSEKVSVGSITAAGTSFTPAGTISATNVQAAIAELDNETQNALSGKASLASPVFTGDPKAPTPASSDNDTSIATTAYVKTVLAQQPTGMQPSNATPLINGVATPGVGVEGSRYDHVHPVDTSRAPASAETAVGTTFTPSGTIAATNVQAALQELATEKAPASAETAVGTSFTPAGNVAATNVQAAIEELDTEKQPLLGYVPVNKVGDTMAGNLIIQDAILTVSRPTGNNKSIQLGGQSALGYPYFWSPEGPVQCASELLLPSIPSTANAANCHIATAENNSVYLSTSSRRFKRDIAPLTEYPDFDAIQPVTYKSLHEADGDKEFLGFISEDLYAVDPRLGDGDTFYDDRAMIAVLFAEVKALKRKLAEVQN